MKKLAFVFGLSAMTLGVSANTLGKVLIMKTIVRSETSKEVEIEAAKLPEKIAKSIKDANIGKDSKIIKAFELHDAMGGVTGYKVVALTEKKEEVFKFDKNGEILKEVLAPATVATPTMTPTTSVTPTSTTAPTTTATPTAPKVEGKK